MVHPSRVLAPLLALAVITCGRPHTENNNDNSYSDPTGTGGDKDTAGVCTKDADCPSGTCGDGGLCVAPEACTDHGECGPNQYCHFVDPPSPWVEGTTGVCSPPCGGNIDCSTGQSCIDGRCYTGVECDPAQKNVDCPPGEVCNRQSRSCTAPPSQCTWKEDCPNNWTCNIDNTCIDPNDVDLGGCQTQEDCDGIAGCENGACECTSEGSCKPRGGCTGAADCATGTYCSAGTCQPATACAADGNGGSAQDACTPYSLVCKDGYCTNPEPCAAGNTCSSGNTCHTNVNPPGCFPDGTNECVRDEQCPAGEYCELFSGTCESGCRDNSECTDGNSCNSSHSCVSGSVGGPGDACSSNADCGGGMACAYNDPTMASICMFGSVVPGIDCSESCHVVCDTLVNAVINTCPANETCGGDDKIMAMMNTLFGSVLTSDSAAVCY